MIKEHANYREVIVFFNHNMEGGKYLLLYILSLISEYIIAQSYYIIMNRLELKEMQEYLLFHLEN